jgi:hypothetical protein
VIVGPTQEPYLGVLSLKAILVDIQPIGNGQCRVDFFLDASGGTGFYSYYRDKDVENSEFKIVDKYPGDYMFSWITSNGWGGPVGFIVWSGFQRPQRATASVWVDSSRLTCP